MGTNFYALYDDPTLTDTGRGVPHIGRRSAAGYYCWDCDDTLCVLGKEWVHREARWYDRCPHCGQGKQDPPTYDAALVELGFASPASRRPTGVQPCSSFNWAQDPSTVMRYLGRHLVDPAVYDEYEREYTGNQFLCMLSATCPIHFTGSTGRNFT